MAKSNEELVNELIDLGYLKSENIIEAFKKVKREDFVPEKYKNIAYENTPLPIGFGQTISQPLVVAFMLELLDIEEGNKILEIGTGSGWQTALMAEILEGYGTSNKKGKIFSFEILEELSNFAEENISKYNYIKRGVVELIVGDGSKGYVDEGHFDRIIAAASAHEIPDVWIEQIKIGGIIVAPVKSSIVYIRKSGKNELERKEFPGFAFVPLVSKN